MAQVSGRSSADPSLACLCANCLVVARLVAGHSHFVLPVVNERRGESARDADATSRGQRVWLKTLRREILGTDDLYDYSVSCPPQAIADTGGRPHERGQIFILGQRVR